MNPSPSHAVPTAVGGPGQARPSLLKIFILFLRVGNSTFGGGDPTMAVLQTELVIAKRWLRRETYAVVYSLARITPGTNLLAFCAGSGWELGGLAAAVITVLAVTAPSAILVVFLTHAYDRLQAHPYAMAAIAGVLAGAVGMIATAAWQLAEPFFAPKRWLQPLIVVAGSLGLYMGLGLSPISVLGIAGLGGLVWRMGE
jgi:chromate transporter